jgi:hypothetical protein
MANALPTRTDAHALAERWLALMEGILVMAKVDQDPATILRPGPALHVLIGVSGLHVPSGDPPQAQLAATIHPEHHRKRGNSHE